MVITLEVADLVVIAGRTIGLRTGQVLDLLDAGAAEIALARARPGMDSGKPASQAATLLCALVQGRPLRRGNQQVALAAMLQFLALNGWDVDTDPPDAVVAVVTGVAAGALGTAGVADWLAPRLRPAVGVKEAPMLGRPVSLVMRVKDATMRRQPTGMFRRFTDRARRAVYLATEEARLLRHGHVGTEHLLLGLVYEGEGLAAKAMESLGLSLEEVRHQVIEITGHGQHTPAGHLPFTPRAKKALELSLREALSLGHNYIGTEHLLLGLLREEHGIAARVLTGLGADHARVQEQVLDLLNQREQVNREAQRTRQAIPAELVDTAEQLDQVRAQKEAALEAEDVEAAKALRDREKQLLAEKQRLERQLNAGEEPADIQAIIAENQQMHRELDRLRGILRDHGIEPDSGTAQTA